MCTRKYPSVFTFIFTMTAKGSGSHLLSHIVSNIVPSAAYVLTIVFGMRTGVSRKRIATRNILLSLPALDNEEVRAAPFRFSRPQVLTTKQQCSLYSFLRKEVIQPQVLLRLPCYDFTPVISPTFGRSLLTVKSRTSGITYSHGVTGGVYKTRERIHRSILICDY